MRVYRFAIFLCKVLMQRTLTWVAYRDFSTSFGVLLLALSAVLLLYTLANAFC